MARRMALSIIVVGLACVGCTSARLKRRVAIVENRATEVEQNLAKLRQLPADVAARPVVRGGGRDKAAKRGSETGA